MRPRKCCCWLCITCRPPASSTSSPSVLVSVLSLKSAGKNVVHLHFLSLMVQKPFVHQPVHGFRLRRVVSQQQTEEQRKLEASTSFHSGTVSVALSHAALSCHVLFHKNIPKVRILVSEHGSGAGQHAGVQAAARLLPAAPPRRREERRARVGRPRERRRGDAAGAQGGAHPHEALHVWRQVCDISLVRNQQVIHWVTLQPRELCQVHIQSALKILMQTVGCLSSCKSGLAEN